MFKKITYTFVIFFLSLNSFAQNNSGEIHGDFDLNMQSYQEDELIGAKEADEIILNNAYLNINYTKGNFAAGLRYESYLNALMDFDDNYKGNGVPFRYAAYTIDGLEVTVGNYYEQVGSGLIFRSYENKGLGTDNAMDGIRLTYSPLKGVYLKSFIGKSRTYFTYADGIIRGADGEININEALDFESKTRIIIGQGFVSRFQADINPKFKLPQNVAAYSTRLNIINGGWNYSGEYAIKLNDPVGSLTSEGNNYANGNALMSSLTYSKRGFGIIAEMHRVDHMEFRSERAGEKQYIINYIPTLSKQHTYTLLALYPSSTQAEGEFGTQIDLFYKIKKGSLLGGKYGTKIAGNFSYWAGLDAEYHIENRWYKAEFIGKGSRLFRDVSVEVKKKINKKWSGVATFQNVIVDKGIVYGGPLAVEEDIKASIAVLEGTYKIKGSKSVRFVAQHLWAEKDRKNWVAGVLEYNFNSNFALYLADNWNYGDTDIHYYSAGGSYSKGRTRFAMNYGRQRGGLICIGGVCRFVPENTGLTANLTVNF